MFKISENYQFIKTSYNIYNITFSFEREQLIRIISKSAIGYDLKETKKHFKNFKLIFCIRNYVGINP